MFAYVVFKEDKVKKIVPVEYVRGFSPQNTKDFDAKKYYKVLWTGKNNEIAEDKASKFYALVLKMASTRAELQELISVKRTVIPKRKYGETTEDSATDMSGDEGTQEFYESSQVSAQVAKRPRQPNITEDAERTRGREMLEKARKTADDQRVRAREILEKARKTADNRERSPNQHEKQKELRRAKSRIQSLEKENDKLKKEVVLLQNLNYSYQLKIIPKLTGEVWKEDHEGVPEPGNTSRSRPTTQPSQPTCSTSTKSAVPEPENTSRSRPTTPTAQPVQPALRVSQTSEASQSLMEDSRSSHTSSAGVNIREDVLASIRGKKSASMMTKELAVAVWGVELADRSVFGRPNNRYKLEPKKCLTPLKVAFIRGEVEKTLMQRGLPSETVQHEVGKVPFFLNQKIQDLNRKKK